MRFLLPHLVDDSARRDPDQAAMRCRGESLTYGELSTRSDRLAAALAENGVRRGDRVGILLGKSLECGVAMHGAMKAGAAYVPLDPGAPPERHAFVLRDCGIRHLVTQPARTAAVDALAAQDIDLDAIVGLDESECARHAIPWDSLSNWDGVSAPDPGIVEQDLCYVLYTSGSTGVPKGIMHTHRSALAWAEVAAHSYAITADDRISNYAPMHFDLSTLDYFAGALAGATVVMIPEEHTRLPASLSALLEEERLTLFYTVPLALIQLATLGALEKRDLSALRWVLFGGEPMPPKHLESLMRTLSGTRFCNVYGPTETNGCTHYPVPVPDATAPGSLPIGRPYPNVDALIVDAQDRPVATGATGELLIRAPTMMQGYWSRPDLNKKAFYERERIPGVREVFHRTGDLVERDGDGLIVFHGRRDRQIKSRGCRVDLDEIEATLIAHPDVHEAAVYAVTDFTGTLAIHAAAIPLPEAEPGVGNLLGHLKSRLPAYAVPVRLALVADFPRTSTGKIDRRTLAADAAHAAA